MPNHRRRPRQLTLRALPHGQYQICVKYSICVYIFVNSRYLFDIVSLSYPRGQLTCWITALDSCARGLKGESCSSALGPPTKNRGQTDRQIRVSRKSSRRNATVGGWRKYVVDVFDNWPGFVQKYFEMKQLKHAKDGQNRQKNIRYPSSIWGGRVLVLSPER